MATNKRISLSQLSECLTVGPSRRKSIIADCADPKPFIAQTYNAATSAISADLAAGGKGGTTIADEIEELESRLKMSMPDWQKQHVRLCIEALNKYQAIRQKLKLEHATILPANVWGQATS